VKRRLPETAQVRPLQPGDDAAVRALFRATLQLGRPLPFELPDMDAYENLSLGWFLGPGRGDAAVLVDGERVLGYTLLAIDRRAFERWILPRALWWGARASVRLLVRRGDPRARRFIWLRIVDGVTNWRQAPPPPEPVLMHFNLAREARSLDGGLRLANWVDDHVRAAGLRGWFGEVNAPAGRRADAFDALGGRVVHRVRNHTLSWLLRRDIYRMTIIRRVGWEPLGNRAPAEEAEG
jgi:hypothetical protein